jgi:hypothetical protein
MEAMTIKDMEEVTEELPLLLLLVVDAELDVPPLLSPLLVVPVLLLPLSPEVEVEAAAAVEDVEDIVVEVVGIIAAMPLEMVEVVTQLEVEGVE